MTPLKEQYQESVKNKKEQEFWQYVEDAIIKRQVDAEVIKGVSQPMQTAEIEFRPNLDDIDEIVCHNLKFLHLEYMDDNAIWINIENDKEQYHIHIHPKNNKSRFHIMTHAEKLR